MTWTRDIAGLHWRRYVGREPVVLVWLTAIAVVMFSVVAVLSKAYTAASQAKASEWDNRGNDDFRAGHVEKAANDFRVALTYLRDNYGYEVSLAQSLLALDRTDEAKAYLTALWQRQPENGTVNLELARLYAKIGDFNNSLRFYHNAIYAIWDSDPEIQRRSARLELAQFLLDRKSQAQAESELIALSGNLPRDPELHTQVGDLFMRVPDYERALQQYESSLHLTPHSELVLASAGRAAFSLARYSLAARYFQQALVLNSKNESSASLLSTARTVQRMDPDTVRPSRRAPVILEDFHDAGARLAACMAQLASRASSNVGALQNLSLQWNTMKPQMTGLRLRRDPDLAGSAMDLAFSIETASNQLCGKPSGADLALLLIAQQREANE